MKMSKLSIGPAGPLLLVATLAASTGCFFGHPGRSIDQGVADDDRGADSAGGGRRETGPVDSGYPVCGGGCPAGLDCVAGRCICQLGGSCAGCCRDDVTCIQQPSAGACGVGGAACKACDPRVADTCQRGQCSCGGTAEATVCTEGLDCRQGRCECVEGGRCPGCCDANRCVARPNAAFCGFGGIACRACPAGRASHCLPLGDGRSAGECSCFDGNYPARESCSQGQICQQAASGFHECVTP
jgi:hypothetical protein